MSATEVAVTDNCGYAIRYSNDSMGATQKLTAEECQLLRKGFKNVKIMNEWYEVDYENLTMTNLETGQTYVIILDSTRVAAPAAGGGNSYYKYMKYKAKYEKLKGRMQ